MQVSDLAGKEAWRKESILKNDEELHPTVVDKLATDPAKGVRIRAVNHKNISQDALWKVVTQKKNFTEAYIMRSAFQKLNPELKVKWIKEKKFADIKNNHVLEDLGRYAITNGMSKSTVKDDFTNALVEVFLSKEFDLPFSRAWILRYYDVKKNKDVFNRFETDYPEELVMFADELKLSDAEVDKYFNKTMDESDYFYYPRKFGGDFLGKMNGVQLTKMLKALNNFGKDDWYPLSENPNFTAEHTLIVFEMNHMFNRDLEYLVEQLPLDEACEKQILVFFENKGDQYGRKNWQVMNAWAKNKTHTRFLFDTVSSFGKDDGWSPEVINQMLASGKYNEDDFDAMMANRSDYDKESSYVTMVGNPNYPHKKLRELWQHYWYEVYKQKEISEPSKYGRSWGGSFDEQRIQEILYNLVAKSALASEFGMDYYEKTGNEDYVPEEAKDIFMF